MEPSPTQNQTQTRSPALPLSVVIVNYRSWPDTERLVASLTSSAAIESALAEVVVVDNASDQAIPGSLQAPPKGVRVVLEPENGGFSSGVNAGWRASIGRWLLVLNPDVVPPDGLIEAVLDRVTTYEGRLGRGPGVVGFELRNPDGSRQPSVGVYPGLLRTVWEQFLPRTRRKYQPDWRVKPGPVDWVTGACMLLNRAMLADLGGMDEDFFLYHEEVALCRTASRRGWPVEFDPTLAVEHLRPLQNRAISPKMRVITRHSKLLYFRKHLPRWQFRALNASVRLEARVRGFFNRVRGQTREARAWQAVARVAKLLADGQEISGTSVRVLAEAAEESGEEPEPPRSRSRAISASRTPIR